MSKTSSFAIVCVLVCSTACAKPMLLGDGRAQLALSSDRSEVEDSPRHLLRPRFDRPRFLGQGTHPRELETNVAALER
jgi:hypothetical protein